MMTLKTNHTATPGADALPDLDAIRGRRTPACRVTTPPCGQPPGSRGGVSDPHHLVLEYLKKIQADLAEVKTTLGEHTAGFCRLEVAIDNLRRDFARGEAASADVSALIDRLAKRVERRLDPGE